MGEGLVKSEDKDGNDISDKAPRYLLSRLPIVILSKKDSTTRKDICTKACILLRSITRKGNCSRNEPQFSASLKAQGWAAAGEPKELRIVDPNSACLDNH